MEISYNTGSFAELGMEDPSFNIWPLNSLDELNSWSMEAAVGDNLHHSFSYPLSDRPMKQLKTQSWDSSCTTNSQHQIYPQTTASPPTVLPYASSTYTNHADVVKPKQEVVSTMSTTTTLGASGFIVSPKSTYGNKKNLFKASQGGKRVSTNSRLPQAQDHILAERKRREKLSQRFIALSATVPGLKKTDKASVLGDAAKYVKQLQERVKTLEEKTKRRSIESVAFVKKHEIFTGDDSSPPVDEPLPEVEAKFSGNDVLVKIHCEKKKGAFERTVAEVEKLHLSVINSNAMSFGNSFLDITILARVDKDFNLTVTQFVKDLRSTLQQFM